MEWFNALTKTRRDQLLADATENLKRLCDHKTAIPDLVKDIKLGSTNYQTLLLTSDGLIEVSSGSSREDDRTTREKVAPNEEIVKRYNLSAQALGMLDASLITEINSSAGR